MLQVRSAVMAQKLTLAALRMHCKTMFMFKTSIDTLVSFSNHRFAMVGLGLLHLAVCERPHSRVVLCGDWAAVRNGLKGV